MKKILTTGLLILFCSANYSFAEEKKVNVELKFTLNEKWKSEELSIMKGMQPPVSRIIYENKVVRVYTDGSALVISKAVKAEAGDSPDKLAVFNKFPLLNKELYKLITADGKIYIPRMKPEFTDPEEKAAEEQFNFIDEIGLLLKSKSTEDFFKSNTEPMDSYLIPQANIKTGETTKAEEWEITRLKDETVNGALCVVFEGKMGPALKTVFINTKTGQVEQIKISQGADAEILYKRLK